MADVTNAAGGPQEETLGVWRARRAEVAASHGALRERMDAQRSVHAALRLEGAHVRETARQLAASCTALRAAVGDARRRGA